MDFSQLEVAKLRHVKLSMVPGLIAVSIAIAPKIGLMVYLFIQLKYRMAACYVSSTKNCTNKHASVLSSLSTSRAAQKDLPMAWSSQASSFSKGEQMRVTWERKRFLWELQLPVNLTSSVFEKDVHARKVHDDILVTGT